MYLKHRKNAVGASILAMEVVPFLILALDVDLVLVVAVALRRALFLWLKLIFLSRL